MTLTSGDDGVSATTDVTVDGTTLSVTAGGGQANATVSEQGPGGQGAQAGPGRAAPEQGRSGQSAQSTETQSEDTAPSPKGVNAGVAYSQDSGGVTIDAADEGLQAAFVNVNGGSLDVSSGDDGINASNGDHTIEGYENADSESDDGSAITISGGRVQIDYANSDGIDSNGSAHVTGGEVVVGGAAGSMDGSVDANGETTLVGVSVPLAVAKGDMITVTGADGTTWTLTSTLSADAVTVLGLSEGADYTVSTTSGGSTTATASALSAGMGGGPGGPEGGPGGQGGQGGPGGQGDPGRGGPGGADG